MALCAEYTSPVSRSISDIALYFSHCTPSNCIVSLRNSSCVTNILDIPTKRHCSANHHICHASLSSLVMLFILQLTTLPAVCVCLGINNIVKKANVSTDGAAVVKSSSRGGIENSELNSVGFMEISKNVVMQGYFLTKR